MSACTPIGSKLPPRRDHVAAAAASEPRSTSNWGDSINVPRARDRLYDFFERQQTPQEVYATLAAALNGDLHFQQLLFMAMMDTWPKLQKNINEVLREVSIAPWKVHPYCERGEKPTPEAEKFAKEIETLIWSMRPDVPRLEEGFEGTIKSLGLGFYTGHSVSEIRWEKAKDGSWRPRSTKSVPARFYGYPYDDTAGDPEDRLMFDPEGSQGSRNFIDFPENRFLIGISTGHAGHPAVSAPLRALAAYWLAAVYGLKWFMSFSQLYGVPWRHGKTDDKTQKNVVAEALSLIGSTGYIVTDANTTIDVIGTASSGQSNPSRELIDLADKQCDVFILGQTLTSGTERNGNKSLGEVHDDTRNSMVAAATDFAGGILTFQFVPAIARLNWGDRDDLPQIWAKREEEKDEKAALEAMEAKVRMGIPMTEAYVHEETNTPIPAKGDKLFSVAKEESKQAKQGNDDAPELEDTNEKEKGKESVKAADADKKSSIDRLAENVGEGLTGVARKWLAPIKPSLMRLIALAESGQITDEDFISELQKMQRAAPEMMEMVDKEGLEEAMMNVISTAVLVGSTSRYE